MRDGGVSRARERDGSNGKTQKDVRQPGARRPTPVPGAAAAVAPAVVAAAGSSRRQGVGRPPGRRAGGDAARRPPLFDWAASPGGVVGRTSSPPPGLSRPRERAVAPSRGRVWPINSERLVTAGIDTTGHSVPGSARAGPSRQRRWPGATTGVAPSSAYGGGISTQGGGGRGGTGAEPTASKLFFIDWSGRGPLYPSSHPLSWQLSLASYDGRQPIFYHSWT